MLDIFKHLPQKEEEAEGWLLERPGVLRKEHTIFTIEQGGIGEPFYVYVGKKQLGASSNLYACKSAVSSYMSAAEQMGFDYFLPGEKE